MVTKSVTLLYRNISVTAQVNGVGENYFRVKGLELAKGDCSTGPASAPAPKTWSSIRTPRRSLFSETPNNVLGQVIMLGTVPCRIIGVTKKMDSNFGGHRHTWRLDALHHGHEPPDRPACLRSISVRVADSVKSAVAEQSVVKLLTQRHGTKDFLSPTSTPSVRPLKKPPRP